jgi:hypothetical protein
VGRDRELAALRELPQAAISGQPIAVVVRGEAGIGKTRLVTEAVEKLGPSRHLVGHCAPAIGLPAALLGGCVLHPPEASGIEAC